MKSIAELRAEEARIRAILEAGPEAELRAIPGVLHVSVGLKQINGKATDEFSIRVYVAKKRVPDSIPPTERIPKTIGGIRTDVNEVEIARPLVDTSKYRPVTGGIQIIDELNTGFGTLGCLATDNTDGKEVFLTNAHVVGNVGLAVFQPDNDVPMDFIGTVKRRLLNGEIDAAIGDIRSGITTTKDEINGLFLNLSNKIAGVADPVALMRVHKVGRTSGLTSGKIVDANAIAQCDYGAPIGEISFAKAMLIQRTEISGCLWCTCEVLDQSADFSQKGDSGAIVVSNQRMAVGLVMASGDGSTYACRMTEVESQLNITISRTVVIGPTSLPVSHGATPVSADAIAEPRSSPLPLIDREDETVWSLMLRRLEEIPFGREIEAQVRYHLPECIDLVNHHRAVMVAWQRVEGPSFLAQWMNGIRNPSTVVPKEINGVMMNSALLRMAAVLKEHGSLSLKQVIDNYGIDVMALLDQSGTVDQLIEKIGKPVSV